MKKFIVYALYIFALVSVAPAFAGPGFGQVVDGVDGRKHTKLAAKENWGKFRGQEVSWSGTVYEVQGRPRRAKVFVADKSRPLYRGYNIVLVTNDGDKAIKLRRGQAISFKGTLSDFRPKNTGAVIMLKHVELR